MKAEVKVSEAALEAAGRAGWWSRPAVTDQGASPHPGSRAASGRQWAEPSKISSSTQGFDLQ